MGHARQRRRLKGQRDRQLTSCCHCWGRGGINVALDGGLSTLRASNPSTSFRSASPTARAPRVGPAFHPGREGGTGRRGCWGSSVTAPRAELCEGPRRRQGRLPAPPCRSWPRPGERHHRVAMGRQCRQHALPEPRARQAAAPSPGRQTLCPGPLFRDPPAPPPAGTPGLGVPATPILLSPLPATTHGASMAHSTPAPYRGGQQGPVPLVPVQRSRPGPARDAKTQGHGLARHAPGMSSHAPSPAASLTHSVPGTGGNGGDEGQAGCRQSPGTAAPGGPQGWWPWRRAAEARDTALCHCGSVPEQGRAQHAPANPAGLHRGQPSAQGDTATPPEAGHASTNCNSRDVVKTVLLQDQVSANPRSRQGSTESAQAPGSGKGQVTPALGSQGGTDGLDGLPWAGCTPGLSWSHLSAPGEDGGGFSWRRAAVRPEVQAALLGGEQAAPPQEPEQAGCGRTDPTVKNTNKRLKDRVWAVPQHRPCGDSGQPLARGAILPEKADLCPTDE